MDFVNGADAATGTHRVRRLLTRGARTLSRARWIVAHSRRLSPACTAAIVAVLDNARSRAETLAGAMPTALH